jgi:uncharacterized protein (TIGR02246 family)
MTKAAFEAASRAQASANLQIDGVVDTQEVRVEGTMAFAWSHLEIAIRAPGAQDPIRRGGHTLSVFRKIDGRWLLCRDANLLVRL